MNKWSRNEKIGLASVIIAILMIGVTLLIPELRHLVGLKSHEELKGDETKPVLKPQKISLPSRPKPIPSTSVPAQTEIQPRITQEPQESGGSQNLPLLAVPQKIEKEVRKPEEPNKVKESKPMVRRGNIKISCYVSPPLIGANETAMIKVFTEKSDRSSVFDLTSYADIFITSPGGIFPSTGTNTLVGKTDRMGYFETLWNPPKDVKGKFSLGVEVKMEGVGTGVGTCSVEIR